MFDRTVCINLDRRPDRWQAFCARFPADWPFPTPESWPAIDGQAATLSGWYAEHRGAWGCLQSHLAVWKALVASGDASWLVLEDDAVCCEEFAAKATEFLQFICPPWDQIYFGGQHLNAHRWAPRSLGRNLLGRNVNRTHAYAISARFAAVAAGYVEACAAVAVPTHVDYLLGDLHKTERYQIICPPQWLIGQAAGVSDVMPGQPTVEKFWI